MHTPVIWLALSALWLPSLVEAARPFMTDDARLATAGSCQLESWTRRSADRTETWALPACNPSGRLEITAGGAGGRDALGQPHTDAVLQVKTLFKTLSPNGWGAGAALGQLHNQPHTASAQAHGQTYAYVPVSVSWWDDRVVSHLNAGWARDRRTDRDQFTWGAGLEWQLDGRWMWIGETFGNDRQKPLWQTGMRYQVLPGLLQLDATWGAPQGLRSSHQWLSLGVRWTPEKFP